MKRGALNHLLIKVDRSMIVSERANHHQPAPGHLQLHTLSTQHIDAHPGRARGLPSPRQRCQQLLGSPMQPMGFYGAGIVTCPSHSPCTVPLIVTTTVTMAEDGEGEGN